MIPRASQERLDRAVDVARRLRLPPVAVARAVRGVEHAAASRPSSGTRRWLWSAVGVAAAVGLAGVVVSVGVDVLRARGGGPAAPGAARMPEAPAAIERSATPAARPAVAPQLRQVDDHVSIAAGAARYRVDAGGAGAVRIEVSSGALGARVDGAGRPVDIAVADTRVRAAAATVAAGFIEGRTSVYVLAGSAAVVSGGRRIDLGAGDTWTLGEGGVAAPAPELVELAATLAAAEPAAEREARGHAGALDLRSGAGRRPRPVEEPRPAATVAPAQRWRLARQLQVERRFPEALVTLDTLAASGDPTWAPLGAAERARLLAEGLGRPEQAVIAAEEFLASYPEHPLSVEVREVRCDALRALGRAPPGCQKTSQPRPKRTSATPR